MYLLASLLSIAASQNVYISFVFLYVYCVFLYFFLLLREKLLYLHDVVTCFFSPLQPHTISGEARHIDGEITKALSVLCNIGQLYRATLTNIFGNLDKYILQFGVWTNTFGNFDKYIAQL